MSPTDIIQDMQINTWYNPGLSHAYPWAAECWGSRMEEEVQYCKAWLSFNSWPHLSNGQFHCLTILLFTLSGTCSWPWLLRGSAFISPHLFVPVAISEATLCFRDSFFYLYCGFYSLPVSDDCTTANESCPSLSSISFTLRLSCSPQGVPLDL